MNITSGTLSAFLAFSVAMAPSLHATPRLGVNTNLIGPVNLTSGTNGGEFVRASNLGDGVLNLTASSSAAWLSATVGTKGTCADTGGNCYLVSISLNTISLAPGTYTGTVTLTDPNAIDSPQDITLSVNTGGIPASPLTAYVSPAGVQTSVDVFPVFTKGIGALAAVSTQSGGNWLQFMKGALAPNLIQVAAQQGQAPGLYLGQVVIYGSSVASDNATIVVRLNVTADPIIERAAIVPVRLSTYQNGPVQTRDVALVNAGLGVLSITSAGSTAGYLSATVLTPNTIRISANAGALAPGVYDSAVTITSNAANNSAVTIPVQLLVAVPGVPLIISSGIVNAANGASGALAQGDIGAIYGNQLAATGTNATNASTPLATLMGGTQVLVNNVPAPLFYVAPGQINFQVPYSVQPGQMATVQVVSNGRPGNVRSLNVSAISPKLLAFVAFISGGYGVITNSADGSLPVPSGTNVPGYATHPAKPGDAISVYAIGFGQTSPAAVEGQASILSGVSTIANVSVAFGGGFSGSATTAVPLFAGLTPTAVGLYQVNVRIPDGVRLGASVPLTISINGVQSNAVQLAISADGK